MRNKFQPSVTFHVETSSLICSANQMTGFYMKCNTGLKWFNEIFSKWEEGGISSRGYFSQNFFKERALMFLLMYL